MFQEVQAHSFKDNRHMKMVSFLSPTHYSGNQNSTPVPILSQLDPVHVTPSHFLKIHRNVILPCMFGSSKWSLSPQVSPPTPCIHISTPPIRTTCPPGSYKRSLSCLSEPTTCPYIEPNKSSPKHLIVFEFSVLLACWRLLTNQEVTRHHTSGERSFQLQNCEGPKLASFLISVRCILILSFRLRRSILKEKLNYLT